jgi:hypothetical protein
VSDTAKKMSDRLVLLFGIPVLLIVLYDMVRNMDTDWLFLGGIIIAVLIYWVSEVAKERPKSD